MTAIQQGLRQATTTLVKEQPVAVAANQRLPARVSQFFGQVIHHAAARTAVQVDHRVGEGVGALCAYPHHRQGDMAPVIIATCLRHLQYTAVYSGASVGKVDRAGAWTEGGCAGQGRRPRAEQA